jgi:PAS domain S-box-containing protein
MTTRLRGDDLSRQQAQIIDQIHNAVIVCDLEERVVSWNQGAQRLFGLPAQAAVGQHLSMIYPSDLNVRARLGEVYRDLWKQGWYEATLPMVDHARHRFSGHLSLSLLRDAKRRVIGTVAIVSDLTLWEGQVRAGEELARLMAETDLETMIFEAEGLALVYANPRACQAVGRSLRELVGTRLTDYTGHTVKTLSERLSAGVDPDSGIETLAGRQICADGSVRLVELRLESINCGTERFYGTRLFPVSEEIERIRREGEAAAASGKVMH